MLDAYRKKRNFSLTKEPYGRPPLNKKSRYVFHKHAARHLHYDLRLELNGVLKSWAVPKGPSLDSKVKRLAVHVEDHPIEYATFEGVIPQHQYGGGTVMIWDAGTWIDENTNAVADYEKGYLNFILKGKKLKGHWHLIKTKKNPKNWLFFKGDDRYARSEKDYPILEKKPNSIISKRSLKEIACHKNKNAYFKKAQKKQSKKTRVKIKETFPKKIHPELATLSNTPPKGPGWIHEVKYDGYRLLCFITSKKIILKTRNQKDWTQKFPYLKTKLQLLNLKNTILDGELVAQNNQGRSEFRLLQEAIHNEATSDLIYYLFDLLYYNGTNLMEQPLIQRKQQLKKIIPRSSTTIVYSEHIQGNGDVLFKKACQLSLEGIVSKKRLSPYLQKRKRQWLKIKCSHRQEFIVIGYTQGKRPYFSALVLGVYTQKHQLSYCGLVGTGFSEADSQNIHRLLNKYKTNHPSLTDPNIRGKSIVWVKPHMVVEVAFTEWTKTGLLRHASFKGLRYDKEAKYILREEKITSQKKSKQ